jgi:hypothetical protein
MGIEPTAVCLGSRSSTTELLPRWRHSTTGLGLYVFLPDTLQDTFLPLAGRRLGARRDTQERFAFVT